MSDNSPLGNNGKLPDHLEDIPDPTPPCDPHSMVPPQHGPAQILDDDQLLSGGLVPVQAWMRTRQSSNSDRVRRYKDCQASLGVKQLNVMAPEKAHDAIKEIAEKTRAGVPLAEVITAIAAQVALPAVQGQTQDSNALSEDRDKALPKSGESCSLEQSPKLVRGSRLQECEQQRGLLQQEVSRLSEQAAIGQEVMKLKGWRREVVARLLGVHLEKSLQKEHEFLRYQRRFFKLR